MKLAKTASQTAASPPQNRQQRRAVQFNHSQEHPPGTMPRTPCNWAERRAIRFKRVLELVPLCESHIYGLQSRGLFPKGFYLVPGGRAVAYWEDEILTWLDQRSAEGDAK